MDDEICDKLRTMINLTEEFQAPIDGIDGLLGDDEKSNLTFPFLSRCVSYRM